MEIDVKKLRTQQRNRRRERAQRMQAERERDVDGGDPDSAEEDEKCPTSVRDKPPRPPLRRKKIKEPSPLLEEDVIDGFAILAFKSYEDLEVCV